MRKVAVTVIVLLVPALALAARPFVTDDARLTTAGSCQLESWVRLNPDSLERWALPACNPGGNLEFTVGAGRSKYDGEAATSDHVFQAKTLFRPLESNGWGWGLAIGTVRHPAATRPGPNILGNTYAYIPWSLSLNDDQIVIHANLGWLKDKATGLNSTTWGVGSELKLHPRLLGIAETYGDQSGTAYAQVGVRYAVVPELFQIDATYGRQTSGPGAGHWMSFGIRYTPDTFF